MISEPDRVLRKTNNVVKVFSAEKTYLNINIVKDDSGTAYTDKILYNRNYRCYNLTVKIVKCATNAMAAALAAVAIICAGGTGVCAAEGEMHYDDDFTKTLTISGEVTDYAVDGDSLALAYGTTLCVLAKDDSGDRKLTERMHGSEIVSVDYAEGELFIRDVSGGIYRYPDFENAASHEFPDSGLWKADFGDYIYILKNGGELEYTHGGNSQVIGSEGYSDMKIYGESAYVLKDNLPYRLVGAETVPVSLEYADYPAEGEIPAGNAATLLKAADYTVKTAEIRSGAYYTQIDTSEIGDYLTPLRTLKAAGLTSCLVLAEEGNASIVATGEGCFITATDSLIAAEYSMPSNDWPADGDGKRLACVREETGLYASPCMNNATRLAVLPRGSVVTVTEKFSLFPDIEYYRVTFTGDDGEVSGFMAANFMDKYDYAADALPQTPVVNGEPSYDDNVVSVILALIIVGLVIIAIAYLTIAGTRPAKKKSAKPEERPEEPTYPDGGQDGREV